MAVDFRIAILPLTEHIFEPVELSSSGRCILARTIRPPEDQNCRMITFRDSAIGVFLSLRPKGRNNVGGCIVARKKCFDVWMSSDLSEETKPKVGGKQQTGVLTSQKSLTSKRGF